jgi:hypothetical protein
MENQRLRNGSLGKHTPKFTSEEGMRTCHIRFKLSKFALHHLIHVDLSLPSLLTSCF